MRVLNAYLALTFAPHDKNLLKNLLSESNLVTLHTRSATLIVIKSGGTTHICANEFFYLKLPEQIELYNDGLEKAGAPET